MTAEGPTAQSPAKAGSLRALALGSAALVIASCGTTAEVGEPSPEPGERFDAGQPTASSDSGVAPDAGAAADDADAPAIDSGDVADAGSATFDAGAIKPDSGQADAGPSPVGIHPLVDTMQLAGRWMPVYPVAGAPTKVGFLRQGGRTVLVDDADRRLWERDHGEGTLFGGFDFDEDGWLDFGLVKRQPLAERCGGQEQYLTWIEVFSGRTGGPLTETAPLDPICWTFSSTTYPTSQWTQQSILFGPPGAPIGLFPVYATNAWFFRRDADGTVRSHAMYYPSSDAFDQTYRNARPNAWTRDDRAHLPNSHIANGLILSEQSRYQALFFTSGRAVQYAHEPLGPNQLLADQPFVSRQNIAGRNYGLVELNEDEGRAVLVSGANILSVFRDHQRQVRGTDSAWRNRAPRRGLRLPSPHGRQSVLLVLARRGRHPSIPEPRGLSRPCLGRIPGRTIAHCLQRVRRRAAGVGPSHFGAREHRPMLWCFPTCSSGICVMSRAMERENGSCRRPIRTVPISCARRHRSIAGTRPAAGSSRSRRSPAFRRSTPASALRPRPPPLDTSLRRR